LVDYGLHRPVGRVGVTVVRGKNIRSPELGLPGSAGCHVHWDPTRCMNPLEKEQWEKLDAASTSLHEIGSTDFVYSTTPVWDEAKASTETMRLRFLLPCDGEAFESPSLSEKNELVFPVLQPFRALASDMYILEPWSASKAAITVGVSFSEFLGVVPGTEFTLGEVCIPFSEICNHTEVNGWFDVAASGTSRDLHRPKVDDGSPQVFLKFRWYPPKFSTTGLSETEREASVVVQEEMVRSAVLNRRNTISFVGSSLGALNTIRGLSGNLLLVQNTLGMVLDAVESTRNAVNFTVRRRCGHAQRERCQILSNAFFLGSLEVHCSSLCRYHIVAILIRCSRTGDHLHRWLGKVREITVAPNAGFDHSLNRSDIRSCNTVLRSTFDSETFCLDLCPVTIKKRPLFPILLVTFLSGY
jgi:hypothetical protein